MRSIRRPVAAAAEGRGRRQRQGVHADVGRSIGGAAARQRRRASAGSGSQPVSTGLNGIGARPRRSARRNRPAATSVLPTPVSVPVTNRPRRRAHARTSSRAATRRSRSAGSWAADRVTRSRDEPGGTVGGRMAGMNRPACIQRGGDGQRPGSRFPGRRARSARSGRPRTAPRRTSASPRACRRSASWARRRSPSGPATSPRPASAAAATGGGSAVVKMNVRARFTSRSRSAGHAGRRSRRRRRRPCPGSRSGRPARCRRLAQSPRPAGAKDAEARGPRPR